MPDVIRSRFADGTQAKLSVDVRTVILLDQAAARKMETVADGVSVSISVKEAGRSSRTTYNAIGLLSGTDANAGTILITAHLDHLGKGTPLRGDPIYNGADDDASGTAAVLELARLLSTGGHTRRTIIFLCFGSEELGGYGSSWFEHHLPMPLTQVFADLNLEQVGLQSPKMQKGVLTGNG